LKIQDLIFQTVENEFRLIAPDVTVRTTGKPLVAGVGAAKRLDLATLTARAPR
jgi:hypothetical protein